jgi:hypothetical protein
MLTKACGVTPVFAMIKHHAPLAILSSETVAIALRNPAADRVCRDRQAAEIIEVEAQGRSS